MSELPRPEPAPARTPRAAPRRPSKSPDAPSDTIQLRQIFGVLRRNRWLILAVVIAAVGVSAYFAFTSKLAYRATGSIRLVNRRQALAGKLTEEGQQTSVATYGDPLRTQIQVLTSRTVAGAVVDQVPTLLLRPVKFSPALLDSISLSSAAPPETLAVTFGATEVVVTGQKGERRAAYGSPLDYPELRFVVNAPPPDTAGLAGAALIILPRETAVDQLTGGLRAVPRDESDVVDVEYTAADPYTARRVVDAVIVAFQTMSAEGTRDQSRRRRIFIEEQLRQNDSLLAQAQGALAGFRSREQTFGTKEKFSAELDNMMGVAGQRQAFATELSIYESLLGSLQRSRGRANADNVRTLMSTPGISSNPVMMQLYERLVRFETTRDSLTTGPWASAATHPDVQQLDTLIASTEAQLVSAVRSTVSSLSGRIAALDRVTSKNTAELRVLPHTEAEEARLADQAEMIGKMGDQLRDEYQRARIAEAVEVGQVEVVDMAGAARPVGGGPRPKLMLGFLVGLVLGVGAAYFRESLDNSINNPDEIEPLFGVSSLAVVPRTTIGKHLTNGNGASPNGAKPSLIGGSRARKSDKNSDDKKRRYELLTGAAGGTPEFEAYVTLRANLSFSQMAGPLRRLVLTSPAPRDGKTTIAANLASAFALQGTRVLLIDSDLRRPRLHHVFDAKIKPGLVDVLMDGVSVAEAVRMTAVPGLSLLPAGRSLASPSQLLGSDQARQLFAALSTKFDLLILDSPPILAVADAAILGTDADGVLLVLRAGATEREAGKAAMAQLSAVGAHVLGVVLNDPDGKVSLHSPYYYNYYTYYSSDAE